MKDLSDAVVERLALIMPDVDVDHFPDAPDRYPWAKARKGLLVGYEGSTYTTPPQSMGPMSSERQLELGVTVLVRSLRGPDGAPALINRVRGALFGWTPPVGGGPLVPLRDQFVSEDQGVWRFLLTFQQATTVVAYFEPTPIATGPAVEADTDVDLSGAA